ncbi:Chemotaxis regulator BdlA [Salinivirga cyanobacteriivorans]|uniref:Chemotaxis regulator BdlA n=1 Tax=Salinivirga cyanobacteriivorans TaxID=1307839 RepID=A0A0S2HYN9_9BACT|nr:GAF domain-containing protein [Salinivirga cyanobacteriivorans]ALO14940.1 Chemotaxis regulator BdlA [Salinivirga cyanobacteriivorans]
MKYRFTIANRLFLGFGLIIITLLVSSILTYTTLQQNKQLNEEVANVYSPSVSHLGDMLQLVNNSKMLIKNWVHIERKSGTPDKKRLRELHTEEFPALVSKIKGIYNNWTPEEQAIFDSLEILIKDTLFAQHKQIMGRLNTFESYDDPMVVFEIFPMVEEGGEVINTTNKALDKVKELTNRLEKKSEQKNKAMFESLDSFQLFIVFSGIIMLLISLAIAIFISRATIRPILRLKDFLLIMTRGVLPDEKMKETNDEIGDMSKALNKYIDGMRRTSSFAIDMGKGEYATDFKPLSEEDTLGNALLGMRDDLKKAAEEEERRKKEDEIRNWSAQGIAKFSDILRQNNDDIEKLSYNIVDNLINYIDAIQGAIYVLSTNEEDEGEQYFEMTAAVAYGRQKMVNRKIELEEGLVGRCAFEKATVYLKEIPEDYVRITSGLGDDNPTVLLLVPLKLNNEIFGVLEIVSFKEFADYQIEFVEKVGENIASTISTVRINQRTAKLLEESRQKGEELASQEEEMRQNMEELQATQEESARRENEMQDTIDAINNTLGNFDMDINGYIISANEQYAELIYKKTGDLVGKEHRTLFDPELNDIEHYNEIWEGLKNGMPSEMEIKYSTQDGDVWLKESYTPAKNIEGEYEKIVTLVMDVTEKRSKDSAIRAYQRELEDQGEIVRDTMEQISNIKEEYDKRLIEIEKEKEVIEEESRVQIESLKMQIKELSGDDE